MDSILTSLISLDPWLIAPFRWLEAATAAYLLGTAILALQCVLAGDLSATLVAYINRGYLRKFQEKMEKNHTLSEKALILGDKESYKAVNKQALDAFGHSFSLGAAIFCVSIWPMPFGLAWLNTRFLDAPLQIPEALPLLGGKSMNYFVSFLLLYIVVRIVYSTAMQRFSWYRGCKARIMQNVPQPARP